MADGGPRSTSGPKKGGSVGRALLTRDRAVANAAYRLPTRSPWRNSSRACRPKVAAIVQS